MSTPLNSESRVGSIVAVNIYLVSSPRGKSVWGTSTNGTLSLIGPSHSSEGAGPSGSIPYVSAAFC